ncbi:Mut7-C RNAse domain-containing protein [Streptomyces sulphureus]|uniref:Mut7-C RNAse domain-containing protein n=1 Tax=Streptomyces sulphureus TaxID=47758 RepID=UPI00036BC7D2
MTAGPHRAPVRLEFAQPLRFFLRARERATGEVASPWDGTSTLGHHVQSAGVPLTEVGRLSTDTGAVGPGEQPPPGARVHVEPVARPQRLPEGERFVLDVPLGALARRLRLLGVDTGYRNDAPDDALLAEADESDAFLLTRDRGLLRRRALRHGAYVRGSRPDDQLADVLDRFAPTLAPWTRCPVCNGVLAPVEKAEVASLLPAGTRRTYDVFARCSSCARVYWRGAHAARLDAIVAAATEGDGPPSG